MDKNSPNLEKPNFEDSKPNLISQERARELDIENTTIPAKNPNLIKPGPLPNPPPSLKEWKSSGKRGLPPVAYEVVIKDAPNNALEYELYHGFRSQVSPWEIEQRIQLLEKGLKTQNQRYTRAAIYYLRKKLEEFVVGD